MLDILLICVLFPVVWIGISLTIKKLTHAAKCHILFPLHFSMAAFTAIVCGNWLFTDNEFLFSYGALLNYIQRGTLKALSAAIGVIGVGSILLGWTYSERDTRTLGKRRIDMIHCALGHGYSLSLLTHIAVTVTCIIAVECAAREPSLWAFSAVVSGGIPQAAICFFITLNHENQEKLAMKLWEEDSKQANLREYFPLIQEMSSYLGDSDARKSQAFLQQLSSLTFALLSQAYNEISGDHGVSEENIRLASNILREIMERVPQQEQALFEETLLQTVSGQLNPDDPAQSCAMISFCFGYYRFLYTLDSQQIRHRIYQAVYYANAEAATLKEYGNLLLECHYAMEWFQFLNQQAGLPTYRCTKHRDPFIGRAFQNLVASIFESSASGLSDTARRAWEQAHPEVN